jgi:hypothetical protein
MVDCADLSKPVRFSGWVELAPGSASNERLL